MFTAARRWFRRNRTPIAIGLGVVGAGYVVAQYVLSKINDARERMTSERIAKENLRRRFEQNQEDCTFTVLALLPTAMPKILEAMDTESITYEIQHTKSGGSTKAAASAATASKSVGSLSPPSMSETNTADEDGRSILSMQSESGVHASQVSLPPATSEPATTQDAGQGVPPKARKTKRQLWDDLTISAITRAYTLIYVLGLLTMLTRIQLNLLGRRSYLSSVVALATGAAQVTISLENNDDDDETLLEQAYGSDFEVNRRYLTFSWWLLNRGWADVMRRVEGAVRQVCGHLSPRDLLSLENFASLTAQVRTLVEREEGGGTPGGGSSASGSTPWLSFLLPPAEQEEFVLQESGILDEPPAVSQQQGQSRPQPSPQASAAALRRLLDETSDLIESPAFSHVLAALLDAGFSTLLDRKLAADAFDLAPAPAPAPAASLPVSAGLLGESLEPPQPPRASSSKAVLLPKILSVLTRQAHAIGNGMPNEYLQAMEGVRDLEGFAAVVYSSNWESEMRDDGLMAEAGEAKEEEEDTRQQQSQVSRGPPAGEESGVLVDTQASLESVWERVKPR